VNCEVVGMCVEADPVLGAESVDEANEEKSRAQYTHTHM
jgi:hypothetical protein